MKHSILYILVVLFLGALPTKAIAKDSYGYTEDHPLIIACDWDFRPFEFLDSDGEPAGYNVEVLGIILNRLEIPHKFIMQEWKAASDMFVKREADLLHALSIYYKEQPYIQTKKYVNYYNLRAVRRIDVPSFSGITMIGKGVRVGVKNYDYAALRVSEIDSIPFTVQYLSPKDGLSRVRAHQCDYYIWGQVPLEKKIQELGIDSLVLDDVKDIPAGELHIIGYDKDVLDAMIYSVSRYLASLAPVTYGHVDAVLLTGAMSQSKYVTEGLVKRLEYLAPVFLAAEPFLLKGCFKYITWELSLY